MVLTLEALRLELAPFLARIDDRLDRIDERLDRIDERLDRIDERLDRIDERLDRIDGKYALLSAKQMNATGTRKSKIHPVGKTVFHNGKAKYVEFDHSVGNSVTGRNKIHSQCYFWCWDNGSK